MIPRSVVPAVLLLAFALAACAGHRSDVPKGSASVAPAKPDRRQPETTGPASAPPGESAPPPTPAGEAPPESAAPSRPEETPPPATQSAYVYSPQQAVVGNPPAGPGPAPRSTPSASTAPSSSGESTPRESPSDAASPRASRELQLALVPSAAEIAPGGIVTMDVMASSSAAVVDAPLHLTFDPAVVEFVDGAPGDFLTQGGSGVVFFADGRSRPGDVAVAAGRIERSVGATGAGLLCRVRFRGTAAGATTVLIGRAKAWNTRGEELSVSAGSANVVVR